MPASAVYCSMGGRISGFSVPLHSSESSTASCCLWNHFSWSIHVRGGINQYFGRNVHVSNLLCLHFLFKLQSCESFSAIIQPRNGIPSYIRTMPSSSWASEIFLPSFCPDSTKPPPLQLQLVNWVNSFVGRI